MRKFAYRFKTEREFISKYGKHWRDEVMWTEDNGMDYLFGSEYTEDVGCEEKFNKGMNVVDEILNENPRISFQLCWAINNRMLVQEAKKPSYAPRVLVRE